MKPCSSRVVADVHKVEWQTLFRRTCDPSLPLEAHIVKDFGSRDCRKGIGRLKVFSCSSVPQELGISELGNGDAVGKAAPRPPLACLSRYTV